jgi:large subunit ribosomal protein L31e
MGKEAKEKKPMTENSIDTTVNIHRLTHRIQFKKKAPRAVSEIRKLVSKMMRTPDVRIDSKLNEYIWSNGIRNLPKKIRVRVSRKRNDEDAEKKSEWYSLVQHIDVDDFSNRLTEKAKSS